MMISVKTFMHQKQTLPPQPPTWVQEMWGGGGDVGGAIWLPHVTKSPLEHTIPEILQKSLYYCRSRYQTSWIANAWEIFVARPRPRLCEIRKFSSISRFKHESKKKVASLPSLGLDSRPQFSDLSFHSQPWIRQSRQPTYEILLLNEKRSITGWSQKETKKNVKGQNGKIRYQSCSCTCYSCVPRGLTVRIAGFHPAGSGSTPGVGNIFAVLRHKT